MADIIVKPTLRDVAQAAGVSPAAVSRVLNNDETLKVSAETRKNILVAADSLGYTKKKYTSKKSRYKAGLIRIYNKAVELEDVYYITLRRNIENRLSEENIRYAVYDLDKYMKDSIEALRECDCLITIGGTSNTEIAKLYAINNRIVCADSAFNFSGIDHIRYDEKKAVDKIFSYILQLNHTKIGLLSAEVRNTSDGIADFRHTYFLEKLRATNLYNKNYITIGSMNTESGYRMMKHLLALPEPPTIVFCANDAVAAGAYKAISNKKMSIPEDISVIGFNDLKTSKYMIPSLTTLRINLDDMADCAVTLLKERIYNHRNYSKHIMLETKLIIRKSCAIHMGT